MEKANTAHKTLDTERGLQTVTTETAETEPSEKKEDDTKAIQLKIAQFMNMKPDVETPIPKQ